MISCEPLWFTVPKVLSIFSSFVFHYFNMLFRIVFIWITTRLIDELQHGAWQGPFRNVFLWMDPNFLPYNLPITQHKKVKRCALPRHWMPGQRLVRYVITQIPVHLGSNCSFWSITSMRTCKCGNLDFARKFLNDPHLSLHEMTSTFDRTPCPLPRRVVLRLWVGRGRGD